MWQFNGFVSKAIGYTDPDADGYADARTGNTNGAAANGNFTANRDALLTLHTADDANRDTDNGADERPDDHAGVPNGNATATDSGSANDNAVWELSNAEYDSSDTNKGAN